MNRAFRQHFPSRVWHRMRALGVNHYDTFEAKCFFISRNIAFCFVPILAISVFFHLTTLIVLSAIIAGVAISSMWVSAIVGLAFWDTYE